MDAFRKWLVIVVGTGLLLGAALGITSWQLPEPYATVIGALISLFVALYHRQKPAP